MKEKPHGAYYVNDTRKTLDWWEFCAIVKSFFAILVTAAIAMLVYEGIMALLEAWK